MLILATVAGVAAMSGAANADGANTDCEFKPTIERLAVGKDVWVCRTRSGREPAGREGRDRGEGRGESSQES